MLISEILKCIKEDSFPKILSKIKKLEINKIYENKYTLLMLLCKEDFTENTIKLINYILTCSSYLNYTNLNEENVMTISCNNNNIILINLLLKYRFNIFMKYNHGDTILHKIYYKKDLLNFFIKKYKLDILKLNDNKESVITKLIDIKKDIDEIYNLFIKPKYKVYLDNEKEFEFLKLLVINKKNNILIDIFLNAKIDIILKNKIIEICINYGNNEMIKFFGKTNDLNIYLDDLIEMNNNEILLNYDFKETVKVLTYGLIFEIDEIIIKYCLNIDKNILKNLYLKYKNKYLYKFIDKDNKCKIINYTTTNSIDDINICLDYLVHDKDKIILLKDVESLQKINSISKLYITDIDIINKIEITEDLIYLVYKAINMKNYNLCYKLIDYIKKNNITMYKFLLLYCYKKTEIKILNYLDEKIKLKSDKQTNYLINCILKSKYCTNLNKMFLIENISLNNKILYNKHIYKYIKNNKYMNNLLQLYLNICNKNNI